VTVLGQIILERRTKLGMSLADVGRAAGFTKSLVWELESGSTRNPGVKTLAGLARALGVTPMSLARAAFEDLDEA